MKLTASSRKNVAVNTEFRTIADLQFLSTIRPGNASRESIRAKKEIHPKRCRRASSQQAIIAKAAGTRQGWLHEAALIRIDCGVWQFPRIQPAGGFVTKAAVRAAALYKGWERLDKAGGGLQTDGVDVIRVSKDSTKGQLE